MLFQFRYFVRYSLFAFYCAIAFSSAAFARLFTAQDDLNKSPAAIEANQLDYDSNEQVVSASGNVQVVQGKRRLDADGLSYDQKTDRITANGNIVLYEPDGTLVKANSVALQQNLTTGTIQDITVIFPDRSHATALNAVRVNDYLTDLHHATYTSCTVCYDEKTNAEKAPLWKIRAEKTSIDEKKESIKYKNARLEVYGVPVFYTPYFSHPTPNASSKSGFLIPKYENSSVFGTRVSTPFYISIAPNMDLTITPTITSKLNSILEGDYRHLIEKGEYELKTSITNPPRFNDQGQETEGHDIRGHIEGSGHFDISDHWTWGFRGSRATDDTYLRKYYYSFEDTLTATANATYTNDRNFAQVETITFQELQSTDDPGQTPLILPHIQGQWESKPGTYGDKYGLTTDALSLQRDNGTSSHRLSSTVYWQVPYITASGHKFEWKNSLRGDGYNVSNVVIPDEQNQFDGTQGRLIPQTELEWSYPLISRQENYRILVSPIIDVIASPYGGNSLRIPNEDSQDIEFSDVNLFSDDHFTGLDRVEEGPRVNYGLKANIDHDQYGYTNLLIGQTYQMKKNPQFDIESGLGNNQSDVVGRIAYSYNQVFDVAYQFRLDNKELTSNRNFIHTGINYNRVSFNMDYLSSHETFDNITGTSAKRELMAAGTKVQLDDRWAIAGTGNRDLEEGAWRSTRGDLIYDGDCVTLTFTLNRDFTRDRDIEPNTSVSFQVSLKNLTD